MGAALRDAGDFAVTKRAKGWSARGQVYDNAQRYGHGLFPFGKCAEEGCEEAACHRIAANDNAQRLVCRAHVPKNLFFVPFLGQQEKLFARTERWVLGGGGAGGSKTYAGSRLWLKQWQPEHARWKRGEIQNSVGHSLFLRRTMPELIQVIQDFKRYYKKVDPAAQWVAQDKLCIFSCGYIVQFGGCEDDDSWLKYYGGSYSLLVVDEAVQFTVQQLLELDTRVRVGDPVLGAQVQTYWLTNPIGSVTKLYLRRRFVEQSPPEEPVKLRVKLADGRVQEEMQVYIPSNLYDNPSLVSDGRYEANIASKGVAKKRALLLNDWYVDEGAWVGDDWLPDEHIVERFRVPAGWTRYKAMDYGYAARTSVGWFAVDSEGGAICYRSWSCRGLTAEQVGERVRAIEMDAGEWDTVNEMSTIWGVADRTLWSNNGEAETRGEILDRMGLMFRPAANSYAGYRLDAAEQVRKRLRHRIPDPLGRLDENGDPVMVPGLRFFDTCKTKIRAKEGGWEETGPIITIPMLEIDENEPDCWNTEGDDHDLDMVGMFCMSRPLEGEEEKPADAGNAVVVELLRIRAERAANDESAFPDWGYANGD